MMPLRYAALITPILPLLFCLRRRADTRAAPLLLLLPPCAMPLCRYDAIPYFTLLLDAMRQR